MSKRYKRVLLIFLLVIAGMFTIHTTTLFALSKTTYAAKTRPNTTVNGVSLGNKSYDEIIEKFQADFENLSVTIKYDDQIKTYRPSELGYSINKDTLKQNLAKRDSWDYLTPWFLTDRREIKIELHSDPAKLELEIATLAEGLTVVPIDEVITSYMSGKPSVTTTAGVNGRVVNNVDNIIEQIDGSLTQQRSYESTFTFDALPFASRTIEVDDRVKVRTVTYDVAVWGDVSSDFDEFLALASETYAHSNGWKRANVQFKRVSSGGNFTLVLAEPSEVDAAAPVCSAQYSCRAGRYVIINDERWRNATSSWNAAGGSLRDYRHMVINHETGHWLGLGHKSCPAAGSPAPVMLQQSISLQGCTFNPWPLSSEISAI